jgi:dienelactone hydrolase
MAITVPKSALPELPRIFDRLARTRRLSVAVVGAGTALACLVGRDGSPPWQATRVVVVAATAALVVIACERSGSRVRGRVALLAGVPAVAIAAGFAPHWAKDGPLLVQASAAILAAAGLVMVVGGTVVATQGRRWWHRIGAGALVVVATVLATFIAGVAIAATNVPRPDIDRQPTSVGLHAVDVALRTPDGVTLAAWYVPSSNRAAVVLLHGAGSTRSDVLDHAAVLADAGFGVLMVDARGHGESDGRAMDLGWYGDADIAAATSYLQTRPDVNPGRIGAVGMSMGGEEAIGASRSNRLIRAVVAEGATARNAGDEAWLSDQYGLRGTVQEQLERLQDRFTDLLTSASVPTSLRAAVEGSGDTRYLLIAAGNQPDEEHAAKHLAAGAPDRVTIWTVAGAGHTDGLTAARNEWTTRVIAFLNDALTLPGDT